jgi:hypothetical protein
MASCRCNNVGQHRTVASTHVRTPADARALSFFLKKKRERDLSLRGRSMCTRTVQSGHTHACKNNQMYVLFAYWTRQMNISPSKLNVENKAAI